MDLLDAIDVAQEQMYNESVQDGDTAECENDFKCHSNNVFVCPIDDFVEDLQEQVDEIVEHLDGHDSQPLKMIVEDKFAEFVQSLDEIAKESTIMDQLRKSWSKKRLLSVLQDYIATKDAAVALGLSVCQTYFLRM